MAGLWVKPLSYRAWEDGRSGLRTNGLAGGTSCGHKQHRQREMSSVITAMFWNATKFKTLFSFEIISNVKLQKFPMNAAGSSPRAAAGICHITSSSLAQLKKLESDTNDLAHIIKRLTKPALTAFPVPSAQATSEREVGQLPHLLYCSTSWHSYIWRIPACVLRSLRLSKVLYFESLSLHKHSASWFHYW